MVAPFFGEVMMVWLVDSGSPSIIITYILVSVVFLVLRRREPDMPRPMRVGGQTGNIGGTVVGVLALVTTAAMFLLYLPGMPAGLTFQPYIMFGAWWLLGLIFVLRIPGGIQPGPQAEHDLLTKLASQKRAPKPVRD